MAANWCLLVAMFFGYSGAADTMGRKLNGLLLFHHLTHDLIATIEKYGEKTMALVV